MNFKQMKMNGVVMIFLPFILVALLLVTIGSCTKQANLITSKYDSIGHSAIDSVKIKNFLAAHDTAHSHIAADSIFTHMTRSSTSLLYYKIVSDSAHNNFPTLDSGVVFNYSLKLLQDPKLAVIDSVGIPGYTVSPLRATLAGIAAGLSLPKPNNIHRGGHIRLLVPSSLGFRDNPTDVTKNLITGGQQTTTVPANSPLIFEITLVTVTRNF